MQKIASNKIAMMFGQSQTSTDATTTIYNDAWEFDFSTNSWQLQNIKLPQVTGHDCDRFQSDKVIVFGGVVGSDTALVNTVWSLDTSSKPWKWETLSENVTATDIIPHARRRMSVSIVSIYMIVYGGYLSFSDNSVDTRYKIIYNLIYLSLLSGKLYFFDLCSKQWIPPVSTIDPRLITCPTTPTPNNQPSILVIIAFVVIGIVVLVIIILAILFFARKRRNSIASKKSSPQMETLENGGSRYTSPNIFSSSQQSSPTSIPSIFNFDNVKNTAATITLNDPPRKQIPKTPTPPPISTNPMQIEPIEISSPFEAKITNSQFFAEVPRSDDTEKDESFVRTEGPGNKTRSFVIEMSE